MSVNEIHQPVETRHALSDQDRDREVQIIAALHHHFGSFQGSVREAYDAMSEQTPVAPDVVAEHVEQRNVQGWWVRPASSDSRKAILFIHGGGYMLGSAKAYLGLASQLAARTGTATFVLDYPLAPEYPFPAAPDAASRALDWLVRQGIEQIALAGDSAGGGLILGLLGQPLATSYVRSVVAFSPFVDLAFRGDSFNNAATYDPVFEKPTLTQAASTYLGDVSPKNGAASPLYAIPQVLPPLAIQAGSDELLLDDARRYADAAAARGGKVHLDIYEGLHHVFQNSTELSASRHALDAAADFMKGAWKTR